MYEDASVLIVEDVLTKLGISGCHEDLGFLNNLGSMPKIQQHLSAFLR